MLNHTLVTIYIVNHNYGRFLEECINSVKKQNYSNIEILLIDDGSTDKESESLLKRYEEDPDIFVIRQENLGLTSSNNVALKNSTGTYIMRLDADDYLDPNALMILYKKLIVI